MTDKEIIENLKKHYKMRSTRSFASFLGLKHTQTLYDILDERNGISKDLAEKITTKCLEINSVWVKTGEGSMLKSEINNDNQPINKLITMDEKERTGILKEALAALTKELADKQEVIKFLMRQVEDAKSTSYPENKKKEAV